MHHIFPQGITNSDKGKNHIKHYNTKYMGIGKIIEIFKFRKHFKDRKSDPGL